MDNNATTQIDRTVLDAMMPYLTHDYANASSTHQFGVGAYEAVKLARKQVAEIIDCEPHEVVFTSGATESINLALKGVAERYESKGRHIVTLATEHSAVLDTCSYLEQRGYEVSYVGVDEKGLVDLDSLKSHLRQDTILVAVMYVNNETGVIQPINEISQLAHSVGAIFFSDCTQAVGKMEISVRSLDIDLLCFSGHKIYAPKGIGVLYVRNQAKPIKIPALIHGGGHERGLRSGTLNVPGIVALGAACALAQKHMLSDSRRISELRDYLETELLKIDGTSINGDIENRLFNVTNICFENIDSDAMIMGLSNPDSSAPLIAVSNGSACTSASIEPSHVLLAMGLSENQAFNCIRFSLGKNNTKEEIETTIAQVTAMAGLLRSMIS
ncbi:cysteine desulfurase family protein [Dyadobacter sp. 676]|uniref:cysteine desulfurase n=1 Tax=Dyadobacter sp. 676 TaxID=3088362 RepID=A0AAU8FFR6_9BACT